MRTQLSLQGISGLIEGQLENPAQMLGPHRVEHCWATSVVGASLLASKRASMVNRHREKHTASHATVHPAGFYEALCPLNDVNQAANYRLRVASKSGEIIDMHDPYAVEPFLSDFDRFLFGEGRHWQIYNKMGAQLVRSMARAASTSPSGHPMHKVSKSSAISIAGTVVST